MNWKTDSQLELLAHLSPLGCGNILVLREIIRGNQPPSLLMVYWDP
jgi:hypothetical protein